MLIGSENIFPIDEDFPIKDLAADCSAGSFAYRPVGSEGGSFGPTNTNIPINTTVVELLHQDYSAPAVRFQFATDYTSGENAVQLQVIVGILDMSVAYPLTTSADPRDDYVRGFTPGYTVSKIMIQNGFITDGIGIGVQSNPPEFRCYVGGELPAPVQGQTEAWNNVQILYKDGQCWVWWNDFLISPDTVLNAALPSPVAVSTPYFPLRTLTPIGKCGLRLCPGAAIRSVAVRDQSMSFSEYTNAQMAIVS